MRYMGSKNRVAKHILPIILKGADQNKPYIEPFVGGGNLIQHAPFSSRWGNDVNPWTVALLKGVSDSSFDPPEFLSEDEYCQIKEDPHGYEPALVGFAAFCCSYAGKEWGGYARGNDSKGIPRNIAGEQRRNLLKQAPKLKGIRWTVGSYESMKIEEDSVVYCDPPYKGVTRYKTNFSHSDFWSWCDNLFNLGCNIFVSEYSAPEGWTCVWQKEVTSSLTKDTGGKRANEKLFTRGP